MPLIAHNPLPSFQRLRDEGRMVLSPERAASQEIREMHIGLLNMMPDTALEATERQFFRLVGESNRIAQFYVHPFTLPELKRGAEAKAHIERYYESFEQIQEQGLDGLIITGANVVEAELPQAPFWEPLQKVMGWAYENVTSTLCSCLATHAVMEFKYGQKRQPLDQKLWGVYRHRVLDRYHPLTRNVNNVFDVPHSRWNSIGIDQFKAAGMKVLSCCETAGVHLATSPDGFRIVCFQGHPEYDTVSLYKEYKRDTLEWLGRGGVGEAPPFPQHYLTHEVQDILKSEADKCLKGGEWTLEDRVLRDKIDNSWRDTARGIVGNWIGLVYQLTNMDRKKPFMDGVDPDDPLRGL